MNIIISGWPAAGSTTLSVLLAYLLDFKYLYGGGVMKYISRQITGVDSGPQLIEFEKSFGPYFDAIWEKYAIWKLGHTNSMLLDGKTGGFFVESENVFEIMVVAQNNVRRQRADKDLRIQGSITLDERDNELRDRWLNTYGINIFDASQIQLNYDLVIDNSNMSVKQELEMVLNYLEEDYRYPQTDLSAARDKVSEVVSNYQRAGKAFYFGLLEQAGLVIDHEIIFQEWKHQFPVEVAQMPDQVKGIVNS